MYKYAGSLIINIIINKFDYNNNVNALLLYYI